MVFTIRGFLMNGGTIALIKQRRLVGKFQSSGATSEEKSKSLSDLNIREGMAVRKLIRHGVLRPSGENLFYLDEAAWGELRRIRRNRVFILFSIILVVGIIFYIVR
jgi:hypothetical protein